MITPLPLSRDQATRDTPTDRRFGARLLSQSNDSDVNTLWINLVRRTVLRLIRARPSLDHDVARSDALNAAKAHHGRRVRAPHVPYRGSTQALDDLLGDHIDVLATNLPAALTAIQGKLVTPLAMTASQRSALVPDIPTLAEAGVDGIDVTSWYGLLAPHAIPNDVRDAIFAVTREILDTPALQEKLLAQGLSVSTEPPDQFAARIRRESSLWADVIKSRHIVAQ
jgi:tripartite-type tricarboxylate transporter receptor subunit TctC